MISRRTALLIADSYELAFLKWVESPPSLYVPPARRSERSGYVAPDHEKLYDHLFLNKFPSLVMNAIVDRACRGQLKQAVLQLHTGETLTPLVEGKTLTELEALGNQYLVDMGRAILVAPPVNIHEQARFKKCVEDLKRSLELDGYELRGGQLLLSEASVLDEREEHGLLEQLIDELGLENRDTGLHHLSLSAEHYVAGKWDDSISNGRKLLEYVFQEVAARHHILEHSTAIDPSVYDSPGQVRKYIEKEGLLEAKEREAVGVVHSLLSETGSHPYIAAQEQARLMRHLALTLSQFALLRLRGYLSSKSTQADARVAEAPAANA